MFFIIILLNLIMMAPSEIYALSQLIVWFVLVNQVKSSIPILNSSGW
jgi:hypothetical protein